MTNPQSQPDSSDPLHAHGTHATMEALNTSTSAGIILRHARESQGLQISALAGSLKVPVKKLEALEMDRYDLLPDAVFVRALASSICRSLKIDAAPVLALLPQSVAPPYRQMPLSAPSSFSGYSPAVRPSSRSSVSVPALMAGLSLVAGAAILVFLPAIRDAAESLHLATLQGGTLLRGITEQASVSTEVRNSSNTTESSAFVGSQASKLDSKVETANLTRDAALIGQPPAVTLEAATMLRMPQSVSNVTAPAASASAPLTRGSQVGASPDRLVTFSAATQPSWVKVTDANGAVVLSRTIAPGEAVSAAGTLPLSVVVGRADATRVEIRGQAFNLTAFSRENVARFEVK